MNASGPRHAGAQMAQCLLLLEEQFGGFSLLRDAGSATRRATVKDEG